MPRINFAEVDDMESGSFTPIPEGAYPCRVVKVDDGHQTKGGDEMWRMELEIVAGEYKGRKLFDNLVFSTKAASRIKFVCSRLGIDTSGEVDLQPHLLRGREAWVSTFHEDYKGKTQNRVPWDGYESMEQSKVEASQSEPQSQSVEDYESAQDVPF